MNVCILKVPSSEKLVSKQSMQNCEQDPSAAIIVLSRPSYVSMFQFVGKANGQSIEPFQ